MKSKSEMRRLKMHKRLIQEEIELIKKAVPEWGSLPAIQDLVTELLTHIESLQEELETQIEMKRSLFEDNKNLNLEIQKLKESL